jgi:hypothetical protein
VLLVALFQSACTAQTQVPQTLETFLASNPFYRLLTVNDVRDIVDEVIEEHFTPSSPGDLNGDGVADVAAVIVELGSPVRFGVVAFHGSTVHWVMRPQPERIVGVVIEEQGRLYIQYCIECDANSFVRWNGTDFEDELWIVGDVPATYDRESGIRPVPLRQAPDSSSRAIANLPECTDAIIVQVLPRRGNSLRWYQVTVSVNGRTTVGFLSATVLTETGCIG